MYQLELTENRFAARLSIGEVRLVVRKESTQKQQKYEVKPNLGKNYSIDFRILKNDEFPTLSDRPQRRIGRKLL